MQEYVLIHARKWEEEVNGAWNMVLLVLKERPLWQKGRFNLCGGHVEDGELPLDAAIRELKEETGYDPVNPPFKSGEIKGNDFIVHCFVIDVAPDIEPMPRLGETEKVQWFNWTDVRENEKLLQNLQVIVPLMHLGATNWKVVQEIDDKVTVEFRTNAFMYMGGGI